MTYGITMIQNHELSALPDRDTHPPIFITGTCTKCGKCCEHFDCPALDSQTRLCKVYPNRPVVCRQWPLTHEHILIVNCPGFSFNIDDQG